MWTSIIIMTTGLFLFNIYIYLLVGYGDFYPLIHLGRIVTVVNCLLGVCLISFMILALSDTSEFSRE